MVKVCFLNVFVDAWIEATLRPGVLNVDFVMLSRKLTNVSVIKLLITIDIFYVFSTTIIFCMELVEDHNARFRVAHRFMTVALA